MRNYVALTFLLLTATVATASADTWPSRPVKVIVPFAAGGRRSAPPGRVTRL
jgi:tripartite-type tricarboxylate transporter receptor subunit TctC